MKYNKIWNSPFGKLIKAGLALLAIGAVLYATCGGADSSPAMTCIFTGAVLTAVGGLVIAPFGEGESWADRCDDEDEENNRNKRN